MKGNTLIEKRDIFVIKWKTKSTKKLRKTLIKKSTRDSTC